LFAKLAEVLQRPHWPQAPRFARNRDRLAHKSELLTEMRALLQTQSRAHWQGLLEAAGVPCAPVHSLEEALAHAQVQALGLMPAVPGERFALTALPLTLNGERPGPRGPAPTLGQHNDTLA
jgi:formyl-CoA transferase